MGWVILKRASLSKKVDENFCVFSRVLRDSTPRYVGPLVGRLVGRSVRRSVCFLKFLGRFCITAPAHQHSTETRVNLVLKVLVHWSMVSQSVSYTVTFLCSLSRFHIITPAQQHGTNSVMYLVLLGSGNHLTFLRARLSHDSIDEWMNLFRFTQYTMTIVTRI